MATNKQVTFLVTNKYYKLDWVTEKVSFEDAKILCDVVSPYSDGKTNCYYRIRTRKEIWLPRLLNKLIEIAPKYNQPINVYQDQLNKFMQAEERKKMREQAKRRKLAEEERKKEIEKYYKLGLVVNTTKGNRLPFAGTYLDGEIEDLSNEYGYKTNDYGKVADMVFLSNNVSEELFKQHLSTYAEYSKAGYRYLRTTLYVEDLDVFAYWFHSPTYNMFGAPIGIVILKNVRNYDNTEAYDRQVNSYLSMFR